MYLREVHCLEERKLITQYFASLARTEMHICEISGAKYRVCSTRNIKEIRYLYHYLKLHWC